MKHSGQVVTPMVLIIAVAAGSLYLLGVKVHSGIKHFGCLVTSGHKCVPKKPPTN